MLMFFPCMHAWLHPQLSVPSLGGAGVQLDAATRAAPQSVPLLFGTPRYLTFRNVFNEELRPPKVVPNCNITFQVGELHPLLCFVCRAGNPVSLAI